MRRSDDLVEDMLAVCLALAPDFTAALADQPGTATEGGHTFPYVGTYVGTGNKSLCNPHEC